MNAQQEVKIRERESALLDSLHQFNVYKKHAIEEFEKSLKKEEEKWKETQKFLTSPKFSSFSFLSSPPPLFTISLPAFSLDFQVTLSEHANLEEAIPDAFRNYKSVDLSAMKSGFYVPKWIHHLQGESKMQSLWINGKDFNPKEEIDPLKKIVLLYPSFTDL